MFHLKLLMPSWDESKRGGFQIVLLFSTSIETTVIDTKITLLSFQQNKNIYYKRILKKCQGLI